MADEGRGERLRITYKGKTVEVEQKDSGAGPTDHRPVCPDCGCRCALFSMLNPGNPHRYWCSACEKMLPTGETDG